MKENHRLIKVESYTVPTLDDKIRLSDFPAGTFNTIHSRKAFKNAIKLGLINVNREIGFTADYISGGELIEIFQNPDAQKKPVIDFPVDVIFEDDYLAIVFKPSGIVVSGNKKFTLENALSYNLKKTTQEDALLSPEPIHRLDYPTSGALLVGKTSESLIALNRMFEEKEIQKTYHAVTIGNMKDSGIITLDVDNKKSKTRFKIIHQKESRKYTCLNLVELTPFTGRKHQLRIHLASIDTPILGDKIYGSPGLIGQGNGLYLHASSLKFIHPITDENVSVTIPLPKKFIKLFPEINL